VSFINQERARKIIAAIENPEERTAIALLLDGVIDFYNQDPSRLFGSFDLAFFVEVLKEVFDRMSGLLQGTQGPGFWSDEPAELIPDARLILSTPSGLRPSHAFNYAATRTDQRVEALLYDLRWRAFSKQELLAGRIKSVRASHLRPCVPAAPDRPFDFLFMVMAVDHALLPGAPARIAVIKQKAPS
jgi:hypothetical protein